MRSTLFRALCTAAALSMGAATGDAQSGPLSVGLSALDAQPYGNFQAVSSATIAGTLTLTYALPALAPVALRLEVVGVPTAGRSFPVFATDYYQATARPQLASLSIPMSSVPGSETTRTSAVMIAAGPRVTVAAGPVRIYGTASGGVAFLHTSAFAAGSRSATGHVPAAVFSSALRSHPANFAWGAGTGVLVPLTLGSVRLSLDAGVRFVNLGSATYLWEYTAPFGPTTAPIVFPFTSSTTRRMTVVGPALGVELHW